MTDYDFKRGDIIIVENPLQDPHGSILTGNHHAVVIQNNKGNHYSSTLVIAYITTNTRRSDLPTNVLLRRYGFLKPRMILGGQLQTISKDDVINTVGHLRYWDQRRLDEALKVSIGLVPISV